MYWADCAVSKGPTSPLDAALALLDRGEDIQLVVADRSPNGHRIRELLRTAPRPCRRQRSRRPRALRRQGVERCEGDGGELPAGGPHHRGRELLPRRARSEVRGASAVAFARGAIPELVEHERTGYLCRAADRDGLIEGIDYFLAAGVRERASEASRRACEDPHDACAFATFARSWREVFSCEPVEAVSVIPRETLPANGAKLGETDNSAMEHRQR